MFIPKRVLVAGATGYLGGHVVRALHNSGHFVRALARDKKRLNGVVGHFDDAFEGQATDSASLHGACDGIEVVFSSLGVRHTKRSPTIWDVDWNANLNLVKAARRAGVEHFVFVSIFGGVAMRGSVPVAEARERVVDALANEGPRYTVLRPTGFFNDMADFLTMAKAGRVWLFGPGESRMNPVHGADIATVVVNAVNAGPLAGGRFLDIGGPDLFTMREIGALAFDVLGKEARYGRIPLGLLEFVGALASPFNTNAASVIKMLATIARLGAVAPPTGTHHLRDFFQEMSHSRLRA